MTVLTIAPDLQDDLSRALDHLPETAVDAKDVSHFKRACGLIPGDLLHGVNLMMGVVRQVLRDNGYVQIRGFKRTADARSILLLGHALGSVFDDLTHQASIVNVASPTVNAALQGNQTEALFLHTDFAMLTEPPAATIVQCCAPDPLGYPYGENGVSVARHILSRFYGTSQLNLALNTPLPFAGTKPDGTTVLTMHPIMELRPKGDPLVRFHPSRIHHGFRTRGESVSPLELDALAAFQEMALKVRIGLSLDAGDVLVVNNRSALHDRGLCSLSLSRQAIRARISWILFVQKLNEKAEW
jgi:alpha-ketoglutarate-dependent taurine dioxygenase